MTKEQSREQIQKLVERFEQNYDSYKNSDYNETQTRREFIDPLFKALGWDIDNEQGLAEAYKEVIHEDRVKVDNETKAPDYCFTVYGQKKFFVEAKKPSVKIKDEIPPAYQVRRYGWSAKLAVSIITDFEEFSVYDCTKKPNPTDKASVSRIEYFTFREFADKFDFLWNTFSKEEGVLRGNLDRYLSSDNVKKGTATVDREFLKSMDEWRTSLATNIALRNASLTESDINRAVQLIIDRLIFLRICEDREIEPYGAIRSAAGKENCYTNLASVFIAADQKYNSGLFDFKKDTLTPSITLDDKVVKSIIGEMYYPESPYQFAAMPVEILGNTYEQFLGKVIRLTDGHRAKIEEKPEVRKAGGVYYTPQYIVDYIVKHTVGELLSKKEMSPDDAAQIKILDPACGSGSFLLGAYQYLLDWHLEWYRSHNVTKKGKNAVLSPDGRLVTTEKKRILLNNIFGVDIDAQAVEVTKLSLLLKCLEGETNASIKEEMTLFHERVLPTLDDNIKCGNSLIGPDYFAGKLLPDDAELSRVNPFDWERDFNAIFTRSDSDGGKGFDCVIGNPPYVRQEMLTEFKTYFETNFKVYHGVADLYTYFIEKGYNLLHPGGKFGIIVANKWMRANYGEPLRRWFKNVSIDEIIDFGDLPVFQGATTYPCILRFAKNESTGSFKAVEIDSLDFIPDGVKGLNEFVKGKKFDVTIDNLSDEGWNLCDDRVSKLLEKIKQAGVPLSEFVDNQIFYGIKTGLNEAFVIDTETKNRLIKEDKKSAEIIKPFLAGRDIKRYAEPISDKWLIFTRRGININKYPAIKTYLSQFKKQLEPGTGRKPGSYQWYEIQDTVAYYEEFENPKIICPAIVQNASYQFDPSGYYSNDKTTIIASNDLYILGILNSKVADLFIHSIASTKQGGYFEYKPMYISKTPIPKKSDKSQTLVTLVDRMLDLHKKKAAAAVTANRDSPNTERIERLIDATDREIDQLVYQLYGLTEEEIGIVEGKN